MGGFCFWPFLPGPEPLCGGRAWGNILGQCLLYTGVYLAVCVTFRQSEACATFEKLSNSARAELAMQKKTRVEHIRSSLEQLVELEIKQGKAYCELLKEAIGELRAI